ncbi:acetoacetyl-CoA synthetase [Aneurinibacillus soli]|uniref:Acetyl-coenzyme A synthetase n=1 Tax=Aneurinibacillus soli TaxID=1500254 RepID=A0A0U5AX40_9BACL|nr:acetoacetate--CoA ligase [Aneurinibacillus soli]PYE64356.1 acetoacetyl-CoA synthetase [Aneurinibacillus soli]BAU28305.1 Acetyl-coenzyme A synthetase [Aneurinibacillus soli]
MTAITEGTLLWQPDQERIQNSGIHKFTTWLKDNKGLSFPDYNALWTWSVESLEDFWESAWQYHGIQSLAPYTTVLEKLVMPGARWFTGARLNYAEHVFRHASDTSPAIVFQSEHVPLTEMSWCELKRQTASFAQNLRDMGVVPGDRVAAYLPNIPQAIIAFLACASIGAIWSSCSPDFGTPSVIDRFRQIEPKVLITVDGYRYNGKLHDRRAVISELQASLPGLEKTILVSYVYDKSDTEALLFENLIEEETELTYEHLPFDHPLWILYSSGTTGIPKAIVHPQGGIILQHLTTFAIQQGLTSKDRLFWFTTTGWMMWNYVVGSLLVGATIVQYDGSPTYPGPHVLWELAEKTEISSLGISPALIGICMKSGLHPGKQFNLTKLQNIGVTGAPLTPDGYEWLYTAVKKDIWVNCTSGGTDVCTGFVGGTPILPVRAGEIQCRLLGAKVEAFNDAGNPVLDEVGELVITLPMPTMPVYFWNDLGGSRYRESYFELFPGLWRHGDWIKIKSTGSCVIYGRSDSTINRQGVRMGTSEMYQATEGLDEVLDSLVVDLEYVGRKSFMPCFVVLKDGVSLTDELKQRIKTRIGKLASSRHIPDEIYHVQQIPRTVNGKKMEVPIRKILLGFPLENCVSPGSMSNPDSLSFFIELANTLKT